MSAVGTGGTLCGHRALSQERNANVRIVLADPHGSALYSWKKTGSLEAEGSSITEGIGTTRITANFEGTPVDDAVRVSDKDAVAMVYRLLREEGLFLGGSTGINVCAGVETARAMGRGHTIVTLLCDRGSFYMAAFNRPGLPRRASRPRNPAAQGVQRAPRSPSWPTEVQRLPKVVPPFRARRAAARAPVLSGTCARFVRTACGQHEHPGNDDAFGLVHAEVNGEDFATPSRAWCGHEHGAAASRVRRHACARPPRISRNAHAAPGRAHASPGCPLWSQFLGGVIGAFAQASSTRSTRRRSISSRLSPDAPTTTSAAQPECALKPQATRIGCLPEVRSPASEDAAAGVCLGHGGRHPGPHAEEHDPIVLVVIQVLEETAHLGRHARQDLTAQEAAEVGIGGAISSAL